MSETTEPIESLNKQLIDLYGIDTVTGLPIWRIVWSEDQFEKRMGTYDDYTKGGLYIRTVTEVREVPKYRQWIQQKFILERLVIVPIQNEKELIDNKLSYEPIWTFEDKRGNALPPKIQASKFIIDSIYAAQYSNHNLARYSDPDNCQEAQIENKKERINNLMEELYGDESNLMGTTISGESIIVPRNYTKREN